MPEVPPILQSICVAENPQVPQEWLSGRGFRGDSPEPPTQGRQYVLDSNVVDISSGQSISISGQFLDPNGFNDNSQAGTGNWQFQTFPPTPPISPGDTLLIDTTSDIGLIKIDVPDLVIKPLNGRFSSKLVGSTRLLVVADGCTIWGFHNEASDPVSVGPRIRIFNDINPAFTGDNTGVNNCTVSSVRFLAPGNNGISVIGHSNTIKDWHIGNGTRGLSSVVSGITGGSPSNNNFDIHSNVLEDFTLENIGGTANLSRALQLGGEFFPTQCGVRYLYTGPAGGWSWEVRRGIIRNIAHDASATGPTAGDPETVEIKANNVLFEDNYMTNCGLFSFRESDDSVLYGNWIENPDVGTGIQVNGHQTAIIFNYLGGDSGRHIQFYAQTCHPVGTTPPGNGGGANFGAADCIVACNVCVGRPNFSRSFYQLASLDRGSLPSGIQFESNIWVGLNGTTISQQSFHPFDAFDEVSFAEFEQLNSFNPLLELESGGCGEAELKSSFEHNAITYQRPDFFDSIISQS